MCAFQRYLKHPLINARRARQGKARLRLRRGQFGGLSVVVVGFQKPNGRIFSLHDHGYADMLSVSVLRLGPVSFLAALSVPSREVSHLYWYR